MSWPTSAGSAFWADLSASYSGRVRLVQFLTDLVYGDAVAQDAVELARIFRRWGFAAPIYAERIDQHHSDVGSHYEEYEPKEGDVCLLHYSTWSALSQHLLDLDLQLVLLYHNVTPGEFFAGLDEEEAARARQAREGLAQFKPLCRLALGDSEFNRRELEALGFSATGMLPIAIDFARLGGEPNRAILRDWRDGYFNLLFVGRVVPNKRHDDAIKVLYCFQRQVDRRALLFFVGAHDAHGPYCQWLYALANRLGLARDVHFAGQVALPDLLSFYHLADVYLSMSEHEGFGVPLVESMYLGVPVVAYAAAAVPYTLGDAGILLRHKRYPEVAELLALLRADESLRARMVARQKERALDFGRERVEQILAGHLSGVLRG